MCDLCLGLGALPPTVKLAAAPSPPGSLGKERRRARRSGELRTGLHGMPTGFLLRARPATGGLLQHGQKRAWFAGPAGNVGNSEMKDSKLLLFVVGMIPVVVVLSYLGLRAAAAFQNGHAWSDMDWNQDGKVGIFEVVEGSDVGQREISIDGKRCIEFFRFKDGYPIRVECGH